MGCLKKTEENPSWTKSTIRCCPKIEAERPPLFNGYWIRITIQGGVCALLNSADRGRLWITMNIAFEKESDAGDLRGQRYVLQ